MAIIRKKRTYRKKATTFKKTVSAIAKKAVMRVAETKTNIATFNTNFGASGVLHFPAGGGCFSNVSQGTGQTQRIGDRISAIGLRLRGQVHVDPSFVSAGYQFSGFRMLLVAGKRPLTSGDMPQFRGPIDPEILTVVSDRYYKLSADNFSIFFNKWVSFKRIVHFAGSVATKNDLYLWIIPNPTQQTGLTTLAGYTVNMELQTYYKDV